MQTIGNKDNSPLSIPTPAAELVLLGMLLAAALQGALWIAQPMEDALKTHGVVPLLSGVWQGLSWPRLQSGAWWLLFFYPFSHLGVVHAALCALLLFASGKSVEPIVGGRHLVLVLLLGSVTGGLSHCAAAAAGLVEERAAIHGSGPALMAVLAMYGTLLPRWTVGAASRWSCALKFARIQARQVAWLGAALVSLWWSTGWMPEAGPLGMLCAMGVGWGYTRMLGFGGRTIFCRHRIRVQQIEQRLERLSWAEFQAQELDPVLDKIAKRGLKSLSQRERLILRWSRQKLEE